MPTTPTTETARKERERVPAPTGLAENEGFADIFAQSISDALELIPRGFSPAPALRANTAFRSADRA